MVTIAYHEKLLFPCLNFSNIELCVSNYNKRGIHCQTKLFIVQVRLVLQIFVLRPVLLIKSWNISLAHTKDSIEQLEFLRHSAGEP